MKIAVNAIPYTRWSGIETFLRNLLLFWPDNTQDEIVIFTNQRAAKFLQPLPANLKIKIKTFSRLSRWRLFLYQQIALPAVLRREKFDLLFCASLLAPWSYRRKIITIHDAAPFILKKETGPIGKIFWNINLLFNRRSALKIITVSEFSKQELIKKLGIKENNLEIIFNGAPLIGADESRPEAKREKYFVTVGNARPRKNLEILFRALTDPHNKLTDFKLLVIGQLDSRMKKLQKKYNSSQIIFTGFVAEKEKYALIKKASALIFPSLHEGFGLPIVEAGKLRTPVVCSDIPAFREIAGDSALFFNPQDEKELVQKIKETIESAQTIFTLGEKGYANARRFNWPESAAKLASIIHHYENPANK
ncbi:TPA: hypothetical protein DCZ15_02505 [Candidatus Falkowbacteria bacterium]|nr:MAG: mannosyltransferase [Candidatus Falkowbacteria bacterium GW2011_GWF2_43_32]HBA36726.1 hypothetical protein [Candidatus Falkowbacteria bacterium]